MKKIIYLIAVLFTGSVSAQTFTKYFGGAGTDSPRDFEFCSNGDYFMAGATTTGTPGDSDIYITRVTPAGNVLWSKNVGGTGNDMAWNLCPSHDNMFMMTGARVPAGTDKPDIFVSKWDENGTIIWEKTYGTAGRDEGKEIIPTSDGGYMISGYTAGTGVEEYFCTLLKVDAAGNQVWMKTYAHTENLYYGGGYSVKETPDGGFIYFGQTHGTNYLNTDFYIAKVNATGDLQWEKTIQQSGKERGQNVYVNSDGTFITVGDQETGSAGDYDVNVRKFDASGNELWSKLFGGDSKDISKCIHPLTDGSFLIAGITRSWGLVNPNFYIIRMDANGNMLWQKNYGGADHEHCYTAKESGTEFVAIGHTRSFSSSTDGYIVRDLLNQTSAIYETKNTEFKITVLGLTARISVDKKTNSSLPYSVYDLSGRKVEAGKISGSTEQLDFSYLHAGMYIFELGEKGNSEKVKLIRN